jgi:putative proteasome-type protease
MTYCIGMLIEAGLVIVADTRTNAGVDNVSRYRKLHLLANGPERMVAAATAGNLSITQSALGLLEEGLPNPETGEIEKIENATSMYRVAQLVGRALHQTRDAVIEALEADKVSAAVSMLVAGRVGNERLRLFQIYGAGNFIECQRDRPYLQIGEAKYGRPIVDRALTWRTSLDEALKIALISFDSTIRSNLAVGPPLDLLSIGSAAGSQVRHYRIESGDPYFSDLSERWSVALNHARLEIPQPPYFLSSDQVEETD